MGVKITVELPEDLLRRAQNFAARSGRPFEAAVVELIDRGVTEPEVERLADNEILCFAIAKWMLRNRSSCANSWISTAKDRCPPPSTLGSMS